MSKKDNLLTPEELAAKKIRKSNGWTRFWAIVVAIALTAGVFYSAMTMGTKSAEKVEAETQQSGENNGAADANSSSGWDPGSQSTDTPAANTDTPAANTDTPAADNNGATNTPATNNGSDAPAANAGANDAAKVAETINAATAKAAKAGYKWHRNCVISKIDVGSATDALNNIIHRVDENADLNSVVGGFIGQGDKSGDIAKGGANAEEVMGNSANYALKATQLKAEDLQNLKVEGNKYTFTIAAASSPQKDNSTPLSRLTNDFITLDEVSTGIKDALGGLSFLLSVKSADVEFKDVKVSMTIDNGTLKEFSYSYYMDVKKLELSVATGTGYGTVEATYSNFSY